MLFYLFLAYEISNRWLWTRLLLSTNKKLSGTFSGNSFLMIVVYISSDNDYSNGCHLGSRYFIGNYSNPLPFLFFFLFFFSFCTQQFWSWQMRKLRQRESTSLAKVLLPGSNTRSGDHKHRTLSAMQYRWGVFHAGRDRGNACPGVHIVQGMCLVIEKGSQQSGHDYGLFPVSLWH